jgi:hypothetical protein
LGAGIRAWYELSGGKQKNFAILGQIIVSTGQKKVASVDKSG